MPAELWGLRNNPWNGQYEITEDGITYTMTLEQVRELREYFKGFNPGGRIQYATVSRWYRDLDKVTKRMVTRTGAIPKGPIEFYPDPEFE